MFTGRRFDYDTGLYYYRARYYNPYIGRFLQTDPIGYGAGMNWYAYCGNNPIGRTDASGLDYKLYFEDDTLKFGDFDSEGTLISLLWEGAEGKADFEAFYDWAADSSLFTSAWMSEQAGFKLWINSAGQAGFDERLFWEIQTLVYLGMANEYLISEIGRMGTKISIGPGVNGYSKLDNIVGWNRGITSLGWNDEWDSFHPLVALTHELGHAYHFRLGAENKRNVFSDDYEKANHFYAVTVENQARKVFFDIVPGYKGKQYPRPWEEQFSDGGGKGFLYGVSAAKAWQYWSNIPGWRVPNSWNEKYLH
jgi:RHS repeat-associated protein